MDKPNWIEKPIREWEDEVMEVGWDDYIIMRAKLRNQVRDGMNEYTWIEKEWRWQKRSRGKGPVPPPELCWSVPWTVGRGGRISTTLVTAHKMGKEIENTGVALAVHRWSRRCFSVGLTVASGSERWFSGDASVDRAAFCACGRWLDSKWAPGPFLPVFIAKFWSRSDTSIPTPNQSSSPQWIAASTPDTVPAIPCPLVKRLQPLHQSLCNV